MNKKIIFLLCLVVMSLLLMSQTSEFYVCFGSFTLHENALDLYKDLDEAGIDAMFQDTVVNGTAYTRVVFSKRYYSYKEAQTALYEFEDHKALEKRGIVDLWILVGGGEFYRPKITTIYPSPTPEPTPSPTPETSASPTPEPSPSPSPGPTASPTPEPTASPSPEPTPSPTPEPSPSPSPGATASPTPEPTPSPTPEPSASPSPGATASPSPGPTASPTPEPTASPSPEPTASPSPEPTPSPTPEPSPSPSPGPTASPTPEPTPSPTPEPSPSPSPGPTASPTPEPTASPSPGATASPTPEPTAAPTSDSAENLETTNNEADAGSSLFTQVGEGPVTRSAGKVFDIAADSQGTPYVLFSDNAYEGKASLYTYEGESWSAVGNPGFSDSAIEACSLIMFYDVPYAAFIDKETHIITVMKYEYELWIPVGNASFSNPVQPYVENDYRSFSFTVDKYGTFYVGYADAEFNGSLTVWKYIGIWTLLGEKAVSKGPVHQPVITLRKTTPYALFFEQEAADTLQLMTYSAGEWTSALDDNPGNALFTGDEADGPPVYAAINMKNDSLLISLIPEENPFSIEYITVTGDDPVVNTAAIEVKASLQHITGIRLLEIKGKPLTLVTARTGAGEKLYLYDYRADFILPFEGIIESVPRGPAGAWSGTGSLFLVIPRGGNEEESLELTVVRFSID